MYEAKEGVTGYVMENRFEDAILEVDGTVSDIVTVTPPTIDCFDWSNVTND